MTEAEITAAYDKFRAWMKAERDITSFTPLEAFRAGVDAAQLAAPVAAQEPDDSAKEWRRLALQFDGHRMQAIGHLKCMLQDPQAHREAAEAFLSAGPLSGEAVLAERIKAIASQPAQGEPHPAEVEAGKRGLASLEAAMQGERQPVGYMMVHPLGERGFSFFDDRVMFPPAWKRVPVYE